MIQRKFEKTRSQAKDGYHIITLIESNNQKTETQ